MARPSGFKPLVWIGSSYKDFCELPEEVRSHMGYALYVAQMGGKHRDAKPLRGFGGAGVVEIVSDRRGDTFRTMYTVRFADAVYVLHAFQKKSKSGRETPKAEMDVVARRLREAERLARGELQ
jgi:phage-related protein